MKTIKTRSHTKDIKVLDRAANLPFRVKDSVVKVKEKSEETQDPKHASPTDYATGNIQDAARRAVREAVYRLPKPRLNVRKTTTKAAKTTQQTAKTVQKTAQATAKTTKAAIRASHAVSKTAVYAAKASVKAIAAMVKAAIASVRGLIAAIIAGGWVSVVIIVIILMIALLVGSSFGIFFSSEPNPDTGQTINSVMAEIDAEFTDRIENIINSNYHDTLNMSGERAEWKNILAVYTIKTASDPNNPLEVAIMDDKRAAILRTVFWDMNTISHSIRRIKHTSTYTYIDENGNSKTGTETWYEYVLNITISHKTPDEMAALYRFTDEQKEMLNELLKPEYNSLWNALLYGITTFGFGDGSMIEVAATQLGNTGGELYWRWYGFSSRVEWCACFVSWCAEQCGYIEAGVIPRFSSC